VSDQPCDETGVRNTGIFIAYFIGNSLNGTITSFQHLLGFFQAGRMYAFIRLQHSRPGETPFDCLLGEAATLDHKGNGRFNRSCLFVSWPIKAFDARLQTLEREFY
jgi:hypothetical protein